MTSKEAERMLDDFLTQLVATQGFSRLACLSYARPVNDVIGKILFVYRWDARGFGAFTSGVGVRFESLARWLSDDPADRKSTLGTPLHFLHEDRKLIEWRFSKSAELERLREPILADLRNYAMPFIEKYSHLDEVVKTVASPNPKDWFNWNINSRVNFLAAVRLTQGDKAGALKLLDDALLERKTALPKNRVEIEDMRRRIVGQI